MRIAISPDENPGDPGTTADPTITERDLNVKVATALEAALKRCGQDAWFDPGITYVDRVQRANSDRTDLLIACAHNAGGGQGMRALVCPGGRQSETPTWSDGRRNRQDDLAGAVAGELKTAGLIEQWSEVDENVFECCQFQFDSGYFELEFMDSAHDQAIYRQPGYPAAAAEAIARGAAHVYGFTYVAADATAPAPAPGPAAASPPGSAIGDAHSALSAVYNRPPTEKEVFDFAGSLNPDRSNFNDLVQSAEDNLGHPDAVRIQPTHLADVLDQVQADLATLKAAPGGAAALSLGKVADALQAAGTALQAAATELRG